MDHFESYLTQKLALLEAEGLKRSLHTIEERHAINIRINRRSLINFSSNDYLGLSSHPAIATAMGEAAAQWGSGSTASRLICGTTLEHASLEEELAVLKKTESSLVFSTGVAATTGTIPAIMSKGDVIIMDKLAHASLIDGARASEAIIRIFTHNNLEKLEAHLKWARKMQPASKIMIITESIFSMEGDLAPLQEIVAIKERYGAILFLDESHAVGVRGKGIQGLAGELGLSDQIEIQMGTLGKALGVSGGYIAGSRILINFLINRTRSFMFSTAPSPAIMAACRASLKIVHSSEGEFLRERLQENRRLLSETMQIPMPASAIAPLILGEEQRTLMAANQLLEAGFFVSPIRYPSVPRHAARLRITLSAIHEPHHIRAFVATLGFFDETKVFLMHLAS